MASTTLGARVTFFSVVVVFIIIYLLKIIKNIGFSGLGEI
jgi:hypothetical protein